MLAEHPARATLVFPGIPSLLHAGRARSRSLSGRPRAAPLPTCICGAVSRAGCSRQHAGSSAPPRQQSPARASVIPRRSGLAVARCMCSGPSPTAGNQPVLGWLAHEPGLNALARTPAAQLALLGASSLYSPRFRRGRKRRRVVPPATIHSPAWSSTGRTPKFYLCWRGYGGVVYH